MKMLRYTGIPCFGEAANKQYGFVLLENDWKFTSDIYVVKKTSGILGNSNHLRTISRTYDT